MRDWTREVETMHGRHWQVGPGCAFTGLRKCFEAPMAVFTDIQADAVKSFTLDHERLSGIRAIRERPMCTSKMTGISSALTVRAITLHSPRSHTVTKILGIPTGISITCDTRHLNIHILTETRFLGVTSRAPRTRPFHPDPSLLSCSACHWFPAHDAATLDVGHPYRVGQVGSERHRDLQAQKARLGHRKYSALETKLQGTANRHKDLGTRHRQTRCR